MATPLLYGEKVTPAFADKVRRVSAILGIEPDWLMRVMHIETAGSFRPDIKNPKSTATGLIQFLESTAKDLGTTTAKLARMAAVDQLDYVLKYLQRVQLVHGSFDGVEDVYLAVFYPKAIAWGMDAVFPDNVYRVNTVFDGNKDRKITKQEVRDFVLKGMPAQHLSKSLVKKKLA